VCKQLFCIDVVNDADDDTETPTDASNPTISFHALTGIHLRSGKTMQLFVVIN
jgi:hypothetical protein